MKTDEEYNNLLGMLGLVLSTVKDRKVEVSRESVKEFDATKKQLVSTYDQVRSVFIFEVVDV